MQIIYARQPPPQTLDRSIFLAGPTPRSQSVSSWRPRAIELLDELGFDGVVFSPEDPQGFARADYTDQVQWEEACLEMADCILFWIPRQLDDMPAFTTNIEFGRWYQSDKLVLGAPPDAPKMRYLRHCAEELHIPQATDLRATLELALDKIGEGARRSDGEREVPLHIWRSHAFQSWYTNQRQAGLRLDGARLRWQYMAGPKRQLFCWALQVNLHIPQEERNKRSELIISRPDISAVLAYHRGATLDDCVVILVREMRSPACSSDAFAHELPGGSSPHDNQNAPQVAAEELLEETGFSMPAERFTLHPARQCFATLTTHRAHLLSVELQQHELDYFLEHRDQRFGAHDSERTYLEPTTVGELLRNQDVDWSHIGMILSVLTPLYSDAASS